MIRIRSLVLLTAILLLSVAAQAQVRQSGNVTPGHITCWTTSGVVQDCGTPGNPAVTGGLGIVNANQVSISINSAALTGPYEQLSFGSTATGGWLQYTPFGGAPNEPFNIVAPSLNFIIGGITIPFSTLVNGVTIPSDTIASNVTGITAPAAGNTLSAVLDATLTATPGSVLYRSSSGWVSLGPGSNNNCLTYVSAGPAVAWGSCSGSGGTGTVTSVATNNGLTGGPITASGTIGLAPISNNTVLANTTGSTGVPTATGISAMLDTVFGSTRGGLLERGASGWTQVTPSSATGLALVSNGTGADPSYQLPALRGFLGGCGMANDVSNPNTVIDTAACQVTSDDATMAMVLAAFTKSTGAWALGTGNGCLDTGSIAASAWYSLFVIERPDTGVVDELCSLSATSPTLPSNYTKQRRVGSFKTAGSAIVAFVQNSNEFLWKASTFDVGTIPLTTAVLAALTVPTGVKVNALFRAAYVDATNASALIFTSPDENDQGAGVGGGAGASIASPQTTIPFSSAGNYNIRTNTSAQIRYRANGTTSNAIYISTYGWVDTRGQQ